MSKMFNYNCEIYSNKDIEDFLVEKNFTIDKSKYKESTKYKNKNNNEDEFLIEGHYIWIKTPQYHRLKTPMHHSGQTSYWTAGILYDDSYSDEWKNYIKLDVEYIGKKNAKLKKEYENAKEKYEELKKKNSKVYNMLKRKFQIPKGQYARFNIIEEKEESKGILGKVKGLFK